MRPPPQGEALAIEIGAFVAIGSFWIAQTTLFWLAKKPNHPRAAVALTLLSLCAFPLAWFLVVLAFTMWAGFVSFALATALAAIGGTIAGLVFLHRTPSRWLTRAPDERYKI